MPPKLPSSRQILGKVKPKANYTMFHKKITLLVEPKYSCTPSLMENTCNRRIFPRISRAHELLLKYLENSALLPHLTFLEKTTTDCIRPWKYVYFQLAFYETLDINIIFLKIQIIISNAKNFICKLMITSSALIMMLSVYSGNR